MFDDRRDEAALVHEWDKRTDGPPAVASSQQRFAPSSLPHLGEGITAWISDHTIVATVLVFAIVCLVVAAGDAAFGNHGIWVAIEALAVLVGGSGAYLWNRASGSGDLAAAARFKRQALGGAFVIVLIAIRIATKAY